MKASDWISVKDKLPRTADYVFVCRECDGERWTSLAAYVRFEEYAHWYDPQGFDIHDVTHWQKIVLPKREKMTKHLIKSELQKLSKDDLINIVAELVSAYVTASINTRMANANCIQQCINQIRTNTQTAINGMVQELSVTFQQIDG